MSVPDPEITDRRGSADTSRWRQKGLDLYDRLAESAARHLSLSQALNYSSAAGRSCHRAIGRWPATRQVLDLFSGYDSMASRDPRATAREISALEFSNRLLFTVVRRQGLAPLTTLVSAAAAEHFERRRRFHRPTILLGWHLGLMFGVAAILARSRIPALIVRYSAFYAPIPPLEVSFTENRADVRSATMWRALNRLRDGGVVLIAADGMDAAQTSPVTCLGRGMTLARGPFSLARLADAALVPVVARWDGRNILADVGDPLDVAPRAADDDTGVETASAAAAGRWLESYLLAAPHTLALCALHSLHRARRATLDS